MTIKLGLCYSLEFNDLMELKGRKTNAVGFEELILKLNPMKTERMKKTLEKVHRKENGSRDNCKY